LVEDTLYDFEVFFALFVVDIRLSPFRHNLVLEIFCKLHDCLCCVYVIVYEGGLNRFEWLKSEEGISMQRKEEERGQGGSGEGVGREGKRKQRDGEVEEDRR
jgi:hypothetical protein